MNTLEERLLTHWRRDYKHTGGEIINTLEERLLTHWNNAGYNSEIVKWR